MFFGRKKSVECCVGLLLEIIEDDLKDGLCTDILFEVEGRKYHIGSSGDGGNSYKNVMFYFDKSEYISFDELKKQVLSYEVKPNVKFEKVTVLECNGCYPDSTPKLQALME